jgi:DNA-binding CsgD family transcriptional regulator
VLHGREQECVRVDRLLADARLGRSASLVVRGAAGIGKTALLDYALQRADGFHLLHVVGIESEGDLPYAGLHALLRPLVHLLEAVPAGQRSAVAVALSLERGQAPERLAVAAGTLSLLAEAAEQRPLLVVVDDAHWLDRASADALAFAARRLAAESIAVLLAARTGERRSFDPAGLPQLELEPLSEEAAVLLLRERFGAHLSGQVAKQLASATAGNPLALVEVPALLTDQERLGQVPLQDPLPVSQAIEQRVRRSFRSLSEQTRHALLLAATEEQAPVAHEALVPAEHAGLVRLRGDSISFRHPLFRAAVYHLALPAERRSAHRELAEHFADQADADRRAWHLAAAAEGPDEPVAGALEAAAKRFAERSGYAAQSRALERAADLSASDDARARRLVAAARAAHFAGSPERALELLERDRRIVHDPIARADGLYLAGVMRGWLGMPVDVAELEREARALQPRDPIRAAKFLDLAAWTARLVHFDLRRAAELEHEAAGLYVAAGAELTPEIRGELSELLALLGRPAEARLALGTSPNEALLQVLVWLEDYETARAGIEAEHAAWRASGNVPWAAYGALALAELERWVGRFPAARAAAAEGAELAEAGGYALHEADSRAILAWVAAAQGLESEAREQAARVEELSGHGRWRPVQAGGHVALGLLELGLGRPAAAIAQLEPVKLLAAGAGLREPSALPYAPDLIEAYARGGNVKAAWAELQTLGENARAVERKWALAAVARLRGFLGPQNELDERFGEALLYHDAGAGSGFERARTELLYGERLRRAKRKTEARQHLRQAIAGFDSLGAASWSERARVELRATGETIPRRDLTAPERLTPQELQIIVQVSAGKTNKEVAAALFISPKTVEYHLTHIYRKLDLHSRAALIRRFAADTKEISDTATCESESGFLLPPS